LNKTVYHPVIADVCDVPIVIDQHAAEPIVWDNLIRNDPRWYAKLFFRWNKSKVLRYDKEAYRQAAGIICISSLDYEITERHYRGVNLACIPQGVDLEYYKPDVTAAPDPDLILFTGTGAIRNVQAIRTFVERIMPVVHKRNPNLKFLWVGNIRQEEHPFLNKPWIKTTGFVDHTPPYFDLGMIYVAPFDMGEGMKTKIIEAMAMGKVIVSTPVGVQGINIEGLTFGRVCSDSVTFADAILQFRERSDLYQLGRLAREHARENYAWDVVLRPLEPFLERCMQRETQRGSAMKSEFFSRC
jgi:glycosyltransferase involved in cell wall biosynthesis